MRLSGIFKQMNNNAEKLASGESVDDISPEIIGEEFFDEDNDTEALSLEISVNPTRWEKAVVACMGMVKQVSKVDPDGLDIVCFGGTDDGEFDEETDKAKISVFRNVKNTKDIESMVTSKLPSGPCIMGKAMDFVLHKAFEKDLEKRPVGILVLTAGRPDDAERLEKSLKAASEKIARTWKKKELPISVTFVHVGDDPKAEEYMQHLADDMVSEKKHKKTRKVVDIVDSIKDEDIQAAMKEIRGTKSSGKTGAIVGAFAGAAMGIGGMYLYNKKQAKKRTKGWNGRWKASFEGSEIAKLTVKDDMKGKLTIEGFPGGKTFGRYASSKKGYSISFRDADEGWKIAGEIEDEHTIFWGDGTRWDEIPPKGASWGKYAAATAAGAATGGAIGYLLDKQFFKKAHKKDQCDYIILMDRSAMMAVKDTHTLTGMDDDDEDDDSLYEEYKPEPKEDEGLVDKFNHLSTGQKVGLGVAGAAAVGGVVAAGVGIAHAVHKNDDDDEKPWEKQRAAQREMENEDDIQASRPAYLNKKTPQQRHQEAQGGFNGKWRSTFDGDELATLTVHDDGEGILTIRGFFGGKTVGKYTRNASNQKIRMISFIDSDEGWTVTGEVKGDKENVIVWSDDTRWDRIY